MADQTRKALVIFYVVLAVIGVIIGALLLLLAALLSPETVARIVRVVLIVCGVVTIIANIPGLVAGLVHVRSTLGAVELVTAALGILLGILLIVYQDEAVVTIVGVYLILFPLLIILLSDDKRAAFRSGWPRMAVGVLLLIALPMLIWSVFELVHLLLLVAGWVVIGLSLLLGIVGVIRALTVSPARSASRSGGGKRLYVDETGDGVVDVIYEEDDGGRKS